MWAVMVELVLSGMKLNSINQNASPLVHPLAWSCAAIFSHSFHPNDLNLTTINIFDV